MNNTEIKNSRVYQVYSDETLIWEGQAECRDHALEQVVDTLWTRARPRWSTLKFEVVEYGETWPELSNPYIGVKTRIDGIEVRVSMFWDGVSYIITEGRDSFMAEDVVFKDILEDPKFHLRVEGIVNAFIKRRKDGLKGRPLFGA